MYSPYAFLIIICWIHFISFLVIIGLNFKPKITREEKDKIQNWTKYVYIFS